MKNPGKTIRNIMWALFVLTIFFGGLFFPKSAVAVLLLDPSDDAFIDVNEPTIPHDGDGLNLSYSLFLGFVSTQEIYVKYDLSSINSTTGRSTFNFTIVNNVWEQGSTATVELYSVTDDSWSEATLTHDNAPAGMTLLESKQITAGTTGLITFGSTSADNPVGSYIENQRTSDGIAAFVVKISNVSGGGFAGSALIEDRENSQTPGISADGPYLDMRSPTAITLSTFNASNNFSNPSAFVLGFALVLILAIVAFFLYRQKGVSVFKA